MATCTYITIDGHFGFATNTGEFSSEVAVS